MKMFILSVATSVIVMLITFFVGPYSTLSNLKTQLDAVEQEVTALQDYSVELANAANDSFNSIEVQLTSTLDNLNSSIATLESSLEDQKTQSSTDIATLKSNISALTSSLTSLTNEVNSLDYDALISSLSALESRVEDLEDTVEDLGEVVEDLEDTVEDLEDEIDDDGDLTAVITSTSGLSIDDGDDAFSGTLIVRVTNDTGDDVDNIILMLSFEADDDIPDVSSAALSGGSQTWYYYGQDDNILYFYNTTKTIDLDDDSYWQKTLTLTVYFDDDVTEDIDFDADVEITGYY